MLLHVIEELGHEDIDPASTAAVGQLGILREQCREAKERLSTDAVTELAVELSGTSTGIELTREKFEDLIADRLTGLIYAFDDMLARNNSSFADLAAVVTVGGGASIPLVSQRLSFHTRLPVLTASDPVSAAAKGALLLATRNELMDLRTRTSIGLMAGVSRASGTGVIDLPAGDVMVIDQDALTDRELAWSQTEFPEVPTRFQGDSYNEDGPCFSMRLNIIDPPKAPSWRRIRLSQMLIGLCAAVAMTAIGGVAITLTAVEQRHTHRPAPIVPSVHAPPVSPSVKLPNPIPTSPMAPSPLPPPPSDAAVPSAAAPTSVEPPPPPPPPPPSPVLTTTKPPPVTTTRPPAATTAADLRAASRHRGAQCGGVAQCGRVAQCGGAAGHVGTTAGEDDDPVAARSADPTPDTDPGAGEPGPGEPGAGQPGAAECQPAEPLFQPGWPLAGVF